jgi:4-amino-4-deoxy-L-arabinose transferase-like glycosyltransferase
MAHSDREARLPATVWWLLAIGAAALAYAHARITVVGPDAARFSFDSAEYALAGRMWLETGRLATPFVHPAALGSSPGPPYPLLVGHPLLPALDALAFALFGLDPLVTLLPAALAFVATVLLVAKLALALSGSRAAALGAAGSFALTPWSLRFASEGLSELPFTALLTAAFFVLWRLPERPRPWLLGVLLGLAQLTRPVAVPLLPAFALGVVVLSPPGQALAVSARTLLAFAPLAALTALYKWVAIGTPFAEVGGYLLLTGAAPEFVVSKLNRMTPPPDALAWIRAHPGEWIAKLVRNILSVSYGVWAQGGRWPVAAALVTGAVVAFRGPARARGFVLAFSTAALLLAGLASATVADARMLFPLLPVSFALGFSGLTRALEAAGRGRRGLVAAAALGAVLLALVPLAREWRQALAGGLAGRSQFRESEWRGIGLSVRSMLPEGGLVASDAAPWVAWFTRRPVTLVPLAPEALVNGPERLRPAAVVLTNEWLIARPGEEQWKALFDRRAAPSGFEFVGHVRSGRLEAVVFRRIGSP